MDLGADRPIFDAKQQEIRKPPSSHGSAAVTGRSVHYGRVAPGVEAADDTDCGVVDDEGEEVTGACQRYASPAGLAFGQEYRMCRDRPEADFVLLDQTAGRRFIDIAVVRHGIGEVRSDDFRVRPEGGQSPTRGSGSDMNGSLSRPSNA